MDEVRLRPVTFADLSVLHHEISLSEQEPRSVPELLVIRYFGTYRDGGAGRGDALYIVSAAEAARKAWYARYVILDMQGLEYAWGDEMAWVTSVGQDRIISCRQPLGIVVGEKCREALKSLLRDRYERFCADTLGQALDRCRQQEQEYRRSHEEHNERA